MSRSSHRRKRADQARAHGRARGPAAAPSPAGGPAAAIAIAPARDAAHLTEPGAGHADLPEPRLARAVEIPMWLVACFGAMLYWGGLYLDDNGGAFHPLVFNQGERLADLEARVPHSESDALVTQGRKVYMTYCVACHQPTGRGTPGQFPPLAGSDWVNGQGPNRQIRIVLNGLQGPITVTGQPYNNVMLPWRDQLSDADIAAVLTFVRGNKEWGNTADAVTPANVAAIREATKDRSTYWDPAELLQIPDKD
jgi:mono/diheme cytochrome c family protein